jgi:uncharacterized membrane protein YfcA
MAAKPQVRRSPLAALLYGAPIGLLGGLIGLGGAEFRLPVLVGCSATPPAAPSPSTVLPSLTNQHILIYSPIN